MEAVATPPAATGNGVTSAPPKAAPAEAATTTYQTFIKNGDGFDKAAEVTVKAGRADLAKQKTVEAAAKLYPDEKSYTVAVTPLRGWQEETFELEQPKPRFVSKGA